MGFRPTDEELKDLLDEVMDISLQRDNYRCDRWTRTALVRLSLGSSASCAPPSSSRTPTWRPCRRSWGTPSGSMTKRVRVSSPWRLSVASFVSWTWNLFPNNATHIKHISHSAELLGPLSDEDLDGIVAELDEVSKNLKVWENFVETFLWYRCHHTSKLSPII